MKSFGIWQIVSPVILMEYYMTIPNSISVFIGSDFIIWGGRQGDAVIKRDTVTVIPLTMNEIRLPLTVSNMRLVLWAIQ
jgi:hypothetical protein